MQIYSVLYFFNAFILKNFVDFSIVHLAGEKADHSARGQQLRLWHSVSLSRWPRVKEAINCCFMKVVGIHSWLKLKHINSHHYEWLDSDLKEVTLHVCERRIIKANIKQTSYIKDSVSWVGTLSTMSDVIWNITLW